MSGLNGHRGWQVVENHRFWEGHLHYRSFFGVFLSVGSLISQPDGTSAIILMGGAETGDGERCCEKTVTAQSGEQVADVILREDVGDKLERVRQGSHREHAPVLEATARQIEGGIGFRNAECGMRIRVAAEAGRMRRTVGITIMIRFRGALLSSVRRPVAGRWVSRWAKPDNE